jgi:hypothetical protein
MESLHDENCAGCKVIVSSRVGSQQDRVGTVEIVRPLSLVVDGVEYSRQTGMEWVAQNPKSAIRVPREGEVQAITEREERCSLIRETISKLQKAQDRLSGLMNDVDCDQASYLYTSADGFLDLVQDIADEIDWARNTVLPSPKQKALAELAAAVAGGNITPERGAAIRVVLEQAPDQWRP